MSVNFYWKWDAIEEVAPELSSMSNIGKNFYTYIANRMVKPSAGDTEAVMRRVLALGGAHLATVGNHHGITDKLEREFDNGVDARPLIRELMHLQREHKTDYGLAFDALCGGDN